MALALGPGPRLELSCCLPGAGVVPGSCGRGGGPQQRECRETVQWGEGHKGESYGMQLGGDHAACSSCACPVPLPLTFSSGFYDPGPAGPRAADTVSTIHGKL